MDFWIDMGSSVLLRVLKDPRLSRVHRSVFFKLFRSIAIAFAADPEFRELVVQLDHQPGDKSR